MKLNWAERWIVNNPARVLQQRFEFSFLKKKLTLFPGASILEIGCGRGAGAALLINEFKPALFHAFDLDIAMIEKAKKYLSAEHKKKILLSAADVVKIPHKKAAMDAVFIFGVLHHVPDWQAGLFEIARVLKPGGMFIFEELYPPLYQNFLTKHILLHPTENRFHRDDLAKALRETGFSLKTAWEIPRLCILGIAEKMV